MNDEGIKELAAAIIFMIAYDYRKAIKRKNQREIEKLEKLLKTEWLELLCFPFGIKPDDIIRAIRKEENYEQKYIF